MAKKRHTAEEIVAKLRQVDVLMAQGRSVADAVRSIRVTNVTTTLRARKEDHNLASQTKYVRAALGLHPQLIKDHFAELDLWRQLLPGTRYVGKVGLDAGPRFYRSFEQQKQVFQTILADCSGPGDKILTVHSARCRSRAEYDRGLLASFS